MTISDNGLPEKKFVFLVVDYRPLNGAKEFMSGLSNEFSSNGLLIEAQSSDVTSGDRLELVLKDPHKDIKATVSGEVVSVKSGWYKSVIEVCFKGMDTETENELLKLISGLDDNSDAGLLSDRVESGVEKAVEVKKEGQLSDKQYLAEAAAEIPAAPDLKKRHKETGPQKVKNDGSVKKKKRLVPWAVMLLAVLFVLGMAGSRYFHDIEKMIVKPGTAISKEIVEVLPPVPDILEPDKVLLVNDSNEDVNVGSGLAGASVKVEGPVDNVVFEIPVDNIDNNKTAVKDVPAAKAQLLPVKEKKEHISIVAEITFGTDSDVVSPDFHAEIDRIATTVADQAGTVVKIEGHTDDIGPEIYNIDLSLRRALAVKKLLNQRGIDRHHIKIEVLGDSDPVTSNDTVSGRRKNRRVVIRTIPPDA